MSTANSNNAPLLKIQNLNASYGPIQALHDVSMEVNKGEIVSLIGSNGAGKSTLLMSIFGTPKPKSGSSILFNGKELAGTPTHKIAKEGIALVPEGRRIFPAMSVEENLIMGNMLGNKQDEIEGVEKAFHLFPKLKERRWQSAGTLSGGEQQMLAIGRGLMMKPKLLLLDEPSLGLAPLIVKQIFEIVQQVAKEGITIFLVEQNASKALKLADRGYVLVNGKIKLSGTGKELLVNPEVQEAYLGGHH